jgi:hypothetical protein
MAVLVKPILMKISSLLGVRHFMYIGILFCDLIRIVIVVCFLMKYISKNILIKKMGLMLVK